MLLGIWGPRRVGDRREASGSFVLRQALWCDLDPHIELATQALDIASEHLGPDYPNTLGSRNNLAGAYQSAGQLERAIPLFEATLHDSERMLGPDHPRSPPRPSRPQVAAHDRSGDGQSSIGEPQRGVTV